MTCLVVSIQIGILCNHAQAQGGTDSLIAILESEAIDSNRLDILLEISYSFFRSDPDLGKKYSLEAIELAEDLGNKEAIASALKNAGLNHYAKSEFREVVNYWNQSLAVFREIDDPKGISNLLSNLGAVYQSKADYTTALEYNIESLKYAELSGDTARIATSLINIGTIYADDELTHDKAQETFEKVLAVSQNLNRADITGTTYNNIGELLFSQSKPKEALPYFEKAYDEFESLGVSNTPYVLNFISKIHQQLGDYNLALSYADRAYQVAQSVDSKIEMSQAAITRGEIYKKQLNSERSIQSYQEAEQIASLLETNNELSQSYEGLAQIYAQQGNYQRAYRYQLKNTQVNEEIRSSENDEIINNLRFQLDLEQKEKEIEILNRDNALKEAEIAQADTAQKLFLALGAFLLTIIGGITYLYRY